MIFDARLLLVPLLDAHDVLGFLLGFLDLFPGLLLFHLKKGDAVGKQFNVILGLLAGDTRSHQLLGGTTTLNILTLFFTILFTTLLVVLLLLVLVVIVLLLFELLLVLIIDIGAFFGTTSVVVAHLYVVK